MATLHIIRSYPGSGKTTFARRKFPGIFHVENDMYMMQDGSYNWSNVRLKHAIEWTSLMVKTALIHDFDVVVSNTFTKRRFVDHYRRIAESFGANFDVYRCIGNFKNVHGLSDAIVKGFKDSMEDYPGEIIVDPEHDA